MFSIVARGSSLLLIRTPERLMGLGQGNAVLHCEVNSTDVLVRLLLNMGPPIVGLGVVVDVIVFVGVFMLFLAADGAGLANKQFLFQ